MHHSNSTNAVHNLEFKSNEKVFDLYRRDISKESF